MKRTTITIVALCAILSTFAQPRAIGGRLSYGVDVSYQHSVGENRFWQIDLGTPGFMGVGLNATHNWALPFAENIANGGLSMNLGLGVGIQSIPQVFAGTCGAPSPQIWPNIGAGLALMFAM